MGCDKKRLKAGNPDFTSIYNLKTVAQSSPFKNCLNEIARSPYTYEPVASCLSCRR